MQSYMIYKKYRNTLNKIVKIFSKSTRYIFRFFLTITLITSDVSMNIIILIKAGSQVSCSNVTKGLHVSIRLA